MRLQLKAFLTEKNLEKYSNQMTSIILLRESVLLTNYDDAKYELRQFNESCGTMLSDFHKFV